MPKKTHINAQDDELLESGKRNRSEDVPSSLETKPFEGLTRYFQSISELHKLENFIRKFLLPYHISFRKHMVDNEECRESNKEETFWDIVNMVNHYQTKTNDCKYSYRDCKRLYEELRDKYPFSSLHCLEQDWIECQKEYKRDIDKAWKIRKIKKKVPATLQDDNFTSLRIPFLQWVCDDFSFECLVDHLSFYCKVFFSDTGLDFNYSTELGLHLVMQRNDFDCSVLTLVPEQPVGDVDHRSAVRLNNGDVYHCFGVASFLSHGCQKHTAVSIPNMTSEKRYYTCIKRKKRPKTMTFPCPLRTNYGDAFRKQFGLTCQFEGCYSNGSTVLR